MRPERIIRDPEAEARRVERVANAPLPSPEVLRRIGQLLFSSSAQARVLAHDSDQQATT